MTILDKHAGLYTDHYELTMAQAYLLTNRQDTTACFDYFFRANPFKGGYVIFAGLSDLLDLLETLRFDHDDCKYLESIGFTPKFVEYLKGFEFRADLFAPAEGEVVFPYAPVIRVEGTLIEAQLIETLLLNIVNFESLIATKASRIRQAAGDRQVIDFGLRRAQGTGGILASKAAVIGGADGTSNVYSAFMFGLVSTGTQAHSWIQAHDDELTAFRKFAAVSPQRCVLLVDTYDTLRSGLPHAILVAKEMEARGERLFGVRLDSGDLAYLAKQAREMLDAAGLGYVKIVASNQLDEYLVTSLLHQGAPIDIFGIGTRLVTGREDAALDGVYKLAMTDDRPCLKISESLEKIGLPGIKKVLRCVDEEGKFCGDCIALASEGDCPVMHHPHQPHKQSLLGAYDQEPLLRQVMAKGRILGERQTPAAIARYVRARLGQLPEEHQRFENPHAYKVGISRKLLDLRTGLAEAIRQNIKQGEEDHESAAGH